jgi:hypothetical protein
MLLHLRITSSLAATGGLGLGSRSGGSASGAGAGAMVTPKRRIPGGRESRGIPAAGLRRVGGGVAFLLGGVGGAEQRTALFIYQDTVFFSPLLSFILAQWSLIFGFFLPSLLKKNSFQLFQKKSSFQSPAYYCTLINFPCGRFSSQNI